MAFEVDCLPVGEESRCGDAIAVRYGNLHGNPRQQTVIVIDGGNLEAGEEMIKFLREHYATDHVDYVVSTHPDNDHVSGLRVVLEEMSVGKLLIHRPWCKAED